MFQGTRLGLFERQLLLAGVLVASGLLLGLALRFRRWRDELLRLGCRSGKRARERSRMFVFRGPSTRLTALVLDLADVVVRVDDERLAVELGVAVVVLDVDPALVAPRAHASEVVGAVSRADVLPFP